MNYLQQLQKVYPPGEARAVWRTLMDVRFGLSHADLLLGKDTELSATAQAELEILVARLLDGEPIQYVLGQADFCGRTFRVAPGVLIPRPETAELVQLVESGTGRLLDVGTGSGCIAVTLALAGWNVTAIDISPRALEIARGNAEALGADVRFWYEDILHPTPSDELWDVIVSNPPYVTRSEQASMHRNVLHYEPHEALFVPDSDPLLFYRAVVDYARTHLSAGGSLYFEINSAYGPEMQQLLTEAGYTGVEILKDSDRKVRFAKAKKAP